jgi:hypothetical protein
MGGCARTIPSFSFIIGGLNKKHRYSLSRVIGNISLLIPRSFSGVVELRTHDGGMELLPALASSASIMRASDRETVVLVGNNAIPQVLGASGAGDLARLCAHSGCVRLGFSGEDVLNESGGVISHLFQKLTTRSAGF